MNIFQSIATTAATFLLSVSISHADPTTTAEVGDIANFLFKTAKCRDFTDALGKLNSGQQTTREVLITTLGVVYTEGYAAGAGNDSSRRADLIIRCTLHPDEPFNTVIPGK